MSHIYTSIYLMNMFSNNSHNVSLTLVCLDLVSTQSDRPDSGVGCDGRHSALNINHSVSGCNGFRSTPFSEGGFSSYR